MKRLKTITKDSFRPYGVVIEYPVSKPKGSKNLFKIILKEEQRFGWRIAYLIVREKWIDRLECHPVSFESFEPVKGKSILYVAPQSQPKKIEAFHLDRPIILKKGIWHGVLTQTPESEIKISENSYVKSVYFPLEENISIK